jgi:uncharacterized membrane protein
MMKQRLAKDHGYNRMEIILGNVLMTGVIISGTVVLTGAFLFLMRHGNEIPSYHIFKPDTFNLDDFRNLLNGLIAFRSGSIMELGILLMIATPVLRVFFSMIAFVYEKDYMYFIFTIIVFLVLIISFFL